MQYLDLRLIHDSLGPFGTLIVSAIFVGMMSLYSPPQKKKLLLFIEELDPHLIYDTLGIPNSPPQTISAIFTGIAAVTN